MTFYVAKTSPIDVHVGQSIELFERAMYGGKSIAVGDGIYIWFCETLGGVGLAASAQIISVIRDENRLGLIADVNRISANVFGTSSLRSHLGLNTPHGELCRKLYKHSHRKICSITLDESAVLEGNFAGEGISHL